MSDKTEKFSGGNEHLANCQTFAPIPVHDVAGGPDV